MYSHDLELFFRSDLIKAKALGFLFWLFQGTSVRRRSCLWLSVSRRSSRDKSCLHWRICFASCATFQASEWSWSPRRRGQWRGWRRRSHVNCQKQTVRQLANVWGIWNLSKNESWIVHSGFTDCCWLCIFSSFLNFQCRNRARSDWNFCTSLAMFRSVFMITD